jgi:DNA-binding LacI/PurR family transcriptional regulator
MGRAVSSMGRRPTSFDIAQLAGVSQPTVSRALRGSESVSEGTRMRIEAIAHQLNYKVDKNASSLRRQTTNTLALLLFEDPSPDGSMINPFFLSMLGSITRASAKAGYDLLISFQQFSSDWHVDYEDSRKADGVILLGYGDYQHYRGRLDQLTGQGTHYVRWGAASDSTADCTIGCDNVGGGYLAAKHLLGLGKKRIAFIGTAADNCPELLDRFTGYCEALKEAGIDHDPALYHGANSVEEDGVVATEALLAAGVEFDAVFAASDLIAIGAMHALQNAGKTVPGDVAIIGFDDISAAGLTSPPLTTIRQDTIQAGEMLVDMLVRRIKNEAVDNIMIGGQLVVRKSCGAN